MTLIRNLLVCLLILTAVGCLGCGIVLLLDAHYALAGIESRMDRIETNTAGALADTNKQLQTFIKDGQDTLDANYYDLQAQVETTNVILRSTAEAVDTVNKRLLPAAATTVEHLDAVAANSTVAVQGLQSAIGDLRGVTASLKDDSVSAGHAIDGAATLLATLNTGTGKTLDGINALVTGAEPIEQDMARTEKHIDGAAAETEEALGYIRDGFRPTKKSFWMKLADAATGGAVSFLMHLWPQRVEVVH